MASNYEQPKLATSKQYNVSPGNIGQVKQQNVDWTDYESAKIWEAVAKGTGQVNEAIQADAKLRGALDQTGNLVANNSWLTQESYDQGRASVVAEQQKGTFLEIVEQEARRVAKANGTMEDYNRAIEPAYQEYIKNIRNVNLRNVNGEEVSVELQKEILANARKEMITYAALGQQKFQKIKEEQNELDRQDLNGNVGSNLVAGIQHAANPGDVVALIFQSYEKGSLLNSQFGDPLKARAETDATHQEALTQLLTSEILDPNNPNDIAKANGILSAINNPQHPMNLASKGKVRDAYTKFKDKANGVIKHNMSLKAMELETRLDAGIYNPAEIIALSKEIDIAAKRGDITWDEATALHKQLHALNGKVADAAKKDPTRLYNINTTQALAEYKGDLSKHAEAVYLAIAKELGGKDLPISAVNDAYYKWATSPAQEGVAAYINYLGKVLGDNMSPQFPLDLSISPEEEKRISNLPTDDIIKQQWEQMVVLGRGNNTFTHAIAKNIPEAYKQAFVSLSVQGKLAKGYLNDMKLLTSTAKNNDQIIQDFSKVEIPGDAITATFGLGGFMDGTVGYKLNWLNAMTDGTKKAYMSKLSSMLRKDPTVRAKLESLGLKDYGDYVGVVSLAQQAKILSVTADEDYLILSENPTNNIMDGIANSTGATDEEIGKVISEFVNKLIKASGQNGWTLDRNVALKDDGMRLTVDALDDRGNALPGIPQLEISRKDLVQQVSNAIKNRISARSNVTISVPNLRGKPYDLHLNMAEIDKEIGNSTVADMYIKTVAQGEFFLYKEKFTIPGNDALSIGMGVTKKSHGWAFNEIKKGLANNDVIQVGAAHTAVLKRLAETAKPLLDTHVGANRRNWDAKQIAKATLILDANYIGSAKKVAEALDAGLSKGLTAGQIIDTFPKVFLDHITTKQGVYNDRGLKYFNWIKQMSGK